MRVIARRARTALAPAVARTMPVRDIAPSEDRAAAEAFIEACAEFSLIDAIRGLPRSAALLADAAFFPVVYRATVLRTRTSIRRLEASVADPGLLSGARDVYVLSTRPHRAEMRALSAALPGARVHSVINDWLPELIVQSGLFRIDPAAAPGGDPADIRYMIFALPRSGSYYLCELLFRAGLGVPKEHLRPATAKLFGTAPGFRPQAFAHRLVELTSRNGYFGTKLIVHYVIDAVRDRPSRLHLLRRWVERAGVRPIYLERRDLALQAVSAVVALQRDSWRFVDAAEAADLRPPDYDYYELHKFYRLFRALRSRLESFLDTLPAVHWVAYEDLDAEPVAAFNGVLHYLDAPPVEQLPAVESLKVRNEAVLAYAERFRDDLRRHGEI